MTTAERLAPPGGEALGRLVAGAAHEVNNALNGAAMNLEVVRLRAVAGRDAGGVAPFAEAAAAEQDGVAAMVAALVALARTPAGAATDVRVVCAAAGALLGPTLRRQGVTLELGLGDEPCRTPTPELAVRLAVCTALDLAGGAARRANAGAGGDRSGVLRCNLVAGDGPALAVAPTSAVWPADVLDVLAAWDIRVQPEPGAARLMFPAP